VIRPGEPWGRPSTAAPDVVCHGDDAALAEVAAAHPGALVQLVATPRSDLARAIGLHEAPADGAPDIRTEVALDTIRDASGTVAVNAVVLGTPPDRIRAFHRRRPVTVVVDGTERFGGRATTIVVASGQYLRGLDLVPRSHPGDGILEIQVYALSPGERAAMRRRLHGGTHLPHPRILAWRGRSVRVQAVHPLRIERDGHPAGRAPTWSAEVEPAAIRLLV
jgi:hypothetical protein